MIVRINTMTFVDLNYRKKKDILRWCDEVGIAHPTFVGPHGNDRPRCAIEFTSAADAAIFKLRWL